MTAQRPRRWDDEHILVTGGGSGIGAAVARRVSELGATVSVVDRCGPEGAAWWETMRRGVWIQLDVTDSTVLRDSIAQLDSDITGVVPCAGVSLKEPCPGTTDAAWEQTLQVNVHAVAVTCETVAARWIGEHRTGSIVLIGSTAAFGHVRGLGLHYHASKGAVVAMTRALAGELASAGIRVNAVAPGLVRTPMTQAVRAAVTDDALTSRTMLRRFVEPEEVAGLVAYLLSPDAAAITGTVVPIEAGQLAIAGA